MRWDNPRITGEPWMLLPSAGGTLRNKLEEECEISALRRRSHELNFRVCPGYSSGSQAWP